MRWNTGISGLFPGNGDKGHKRPLPKPTVEMPGPDQRNWNAALVRAVIENPIYCGLGPYPAIVTTEQWVRTNLVNIEKEGPEQFLVNMLHLLKSTLGTVEKDDYPTFGEEQGADDAGPT